MHKSKNSSAPYLALTVGVLLIGLSPILIKLANAPGIVTSFYRFLFGTLALSVPFILSQRKKKRKFPRKGLFYAILAGFFLATDMALWTTGIVASNATLPTLVGNLAPVWVGIGAIFLYKEKQTTGFWAGLLIAVIGVGFLVGKDFSRPSATLNGILFGLSAGIFYSGYLLFTQSGRSFLDTLNYLFFSTASTMVFAFIFVIVFQQPLTGYDKQTWLLWLAMGLGIQVGGWFLINYSQGFLPASVISPTLLGQPVITAIIAIIFLGENLTVWHIVGGIIIVSGIYMVHFSRKK